MSRCPGNGCGKAIGAEMVACKSCWFKVPKPLRDRIWALYRREQGSDEHRAAVFEAVQLLARQPAKGWDV